MLLFLLKGIEWLLRRAYVPQKITKHVLITGCDTGFGHGAAKRITLLGVRVFAGCYTEQGVNLLKEYTAHQSVFNVVIQNWIIMYM